jgi:hypothetical protein
VGRSFGLGSGFVLFFLLGRFVGFAAEERVAGEKALDGENQIARPAIFERSRERPLAIKARVSRRITKNSVAASWDGSSHGTMQR